jgi:hypothetical protein
VPPTAAHLISMWFEAGPPTGAVTEPRHPGQAEARSEDDRVPTSRVRSTEGLSDRGQQRRMGVVDISRGGDPVNP